MSDAYTCPSCGARITPFAAGCAYCGSDLDVSRHRRPPGIVARLRGNRRARSRPRPSITSLRRR